MFCQSASLGGVGGDTSTCGGDDGDGFGAAHRARVCVLDSFLPPRIT